MDIMGRNVGMGPYLLISSLFAQMLSFYFQRLGSAKSIMARQIPCLFSSFYTEKKIIFTFGSFIVTGCSFLFSSQPKLFATRFFSFVSSSNAKCRDLKTRDGV